MGNHENITRIPLAGGSGIIPTGAMQFAEDWPGLFIRGDDAIHMMIAIRNLQERLADHPDMIVASAVIKLGSYAEMISRDVICSG